MLAAETVARPAPALAGTDGDLVLGIDGQLTSGVTGLNTTAPTGFHAVATGNTAVLGSGQIGLDGRGTLIGVFGDGPTGVSGLSLSSSGSGVYGENDSTTGGNGVQGRADHGTGVSGLGGTYGVSGEGDTGVFGFGSAGNGVFGETAVNTASGVYGQNDGTGYGVAGRAVYGTGVLADSAGGTALQVSGKAVFSRSGLATIAFPAKSHTLTGVALTASSLILATVQNSVGVWVASVVPNVSGSSFTINLNKAPGTSLNPKTAHVAWFVVN